MAGFPFITGLGVYRQTFVYRDAKGETSTLRFYIDEGGTGDADAVQVFAVSLRNAISALTNAALQSANGVLTEYGVAQYGSHSTGGAYEAIEEKAVMSFQDNSGQLHRWQIPAPLIALFLADKVTIDPTNSLVTTFNNLITQAAPAVHVVSRQDIGMANFMGGLFAARKLHRRLNIYTLTPPLTPAEPAE